MNISVENLTHIFQGSILSTGLLRLSEQMMRLPNRTLSPLFDHQNNHSSAEKYGTPLHIFLSKDDSV